MVNRKSRNAQFLTNGSPRKRMIDLLKGKKIKKEDDLEIRIKKPIKKTTGEKYLKKTVFNLKNIISTIENNEEFLEQLINCINSKLKVRYENTNYKIVSDIHQIIIINSKVGKLLLSKTHLKNALNEIQAVNKEA